MHICQAGKLLSILLFFIAACVPVEEKKETPFDTSFANQDVRDIYQLQTKQIRDSLLQYLTSEDPSLRFAAVRAFASFQDTTILDQILPLLMDSNGKVRAMAAQAIGLIGSPKAEAQLTAAFDGRDSARLYQEANGAILEAMGRIGSTKSLIALSTISNYQNIDTLLLLGQVRGIYRYSLRDMVVPEGTSTMVNYFTNTSVPYEVRLIAGHYLQRTVNLDLAPFADGLIASWHGETNPYLRMCLATAIGKLKTPGARDILVQSLQAESDYRVKCNILRALQVFGYDDISGIFLEFAKSGNAAMAEVASQYFVNQGKEKDATRYKNAVEQCRTWQAKTRMAEAANKYMTSMFSAQKTTLQNEISTRLENTRDVYEKAAWLKAWASEIRNFESLPKYTAPAYHVVVRTQAVQSLIDVPKDKNFDSYFSGEGHLIKSQIGGYLANAMRSGDAGILALVAGAIADPKTGFKDVLRDQQSELSKAQARLKLPEEMETYLELAKALREYNVETPEIPADQKLYKDIDWELVNQVTANSIAHIVTSKGDIKILLFPEQAPGSVANFIQLAKDGFYSDKAFHRVVPNFVVQTGCPRGDGFGSLGFTIRSEVANAYYNDEGFVGMASAGLHTEGTQFFITHSPTPHLDGRYSIFGKVSEGMDVVHNITIGDSIKAINIIY